MAAPARRSRTDRVEQHGFVATRPPGRSTRAVRRGDDGRDRSQRVTDRGVSSSESDDRADARRAPARAREDVGSHSLTGRSRARTRSWPTSSSSVAGWASSRQTTTAAPSSRGRRRCPRVASRIDRGVRRVSAIVGPVATRSVLRATPASVVLESRSLVVASAALRSSSALALAAAISSSSYP